MPIRTAIPNVPIELSGRLAVRLALASDGDCLK
jgi:hypothetical protein